MLHIVIRHAQLQCNCITLHH